MSHVYIIEGFEGLQGFFDQLAADCDDISWEPWMLDEMDRLADWEARIFGAQTDPLGNPWPALAPSTVARKGHSIIMIDSDRLAASESTRSHGSSGDEVREAVQTNDGCRIEFGSNVEYGPYHNHPYKNRPARIHLGITDEYLDGVAERANDHRFDQIQKK